MAGKRKGGRRRRGRPGRKRGLKVKGQGRASGKGRITPKEAFNVVIGKPFPKRFTDQEGGVAAIRGKRTTTRKRKKRK